MVPANEKNAVLARWEKTLSARENLPAVFDPAGGRSRTFGDIEREAREFGERLATFATGTVAALQIGNSPTWPGVLLACFRRNLIVLPLGGHTEKAELEAALGITGAGMIAALDGGDVRFSTIAGATPAAFPTPAPELLKLTSGTTGAPRVIRFRSAQLVADCDNICSTMGFGPGDRNFGVIPFSHSYGFSNLITPLLCAGVPLVASPDRMPRAILDALRRSEATVFPGMPVFYQVLAGIEDDLSLPSLRLCISAGAPLTPGVGGTFTERTGLKVHTFYGSSECGGISYDRSDDPVYESGFVGTAMDNVDLICRECQGGEGRIEVHSAAVGDGYYPDSDPTTLGDGRFIPGDLIRHGERGLYLTGRVSDLINVAGRKLNPAEVETRISAVPGVKQVVVFGVASRLRHEEAVACLVTDDTVDIAEVRQACRRVLSAWQVPKDFWRVGEIPTSERGKVSRRELARRYLSRQRELLAEAGSTPDRGPYSDFNDG